jgi:four helix bundle protein
MARVNTFRDLVAWRKGMELARRVYAATSQMPKTEQVGLTLQIRRAVISIPSNIAEGFGRQSRLELLKFLRIARGSLNEVSTQIQLAYELDMLTNNEQINPMIAETDRVLQGLIRSLERKTT